MHLSESREIQAEGNSKQKVCGQGVLGILRTRRWHFEELVTETPPAQPLTGDTEVDEK